MTETMTQVAPYPDELLNLVTSLRYRRDRGWQVWLDPGMVRDPASTHGGESKGLTLVVTRCGPNSYNPNEVMRVNHYFPVPPATYNRESWMRWLFDRLGDVDTHERMEDFAFVKVEHSISGGQSIPQQLERPYAPNHGPGWDPYLITVERTETDRRTSFRGEVNPS